ncbi:MAG: adenosine kinase [Spirochaetales bacterium]
MTLLGVGHALVDAYAFTADEVPLRLGLHTGSFNTVPDYRMRAILLTLGQKHLTAGGSSANVAKLASGLGLSTFFVSQCGNDDEGSLFESELQAAGVTTLLRRTDSPTGICVTFLSPRGNRTIATYRSASEGLPAALVSDALLEAADIVSLEGYLLEETGVMESLLERCRAKQKAVAFDTSDPVLTTRHRKRLERFLRAGDIQYLFAQEEEARCLSGSTSDEALVSFSPLVRSFVVKRGELGCRLYDGGNFIDVPASTEEPFDTTGAGDALQAGFFWGLDRGLTLRSACECGCLVAETVLRQPGTKVDQATMATLLKDLETRY